MSYIKFRHFLIVMLTWLLLFFSLFQKPESQLSYLFVVIYGLSSKSIKSITFIS